MAGIESFKVKSLVFLMQVIQFYPYLRIVSIYACITYKKTNKEEIPLTLSRPDCLMEFCKVTLTFESVDEIL